MMKEVVAQDLIEPIKMLKSEEAGALQMNVEVSEL
jgi:hypothetical protein